MNKVFLCSALLALFACTQPAREGTTVSGTLIEGQGRMVKLSELLPEGIKAKDSVMAGAGGTFSFSITPERNNFYVLSTGPGNLLVLVIMKGEQVKITGDYTGFPMRVAIEGSPESKSLYDFFTYTQGNRRKADSLQTVLMEHQNDPDFPKMVEQTDPMFMKIWNDQVVYEKKYILEHPLSLSSLIVVNYSFGPRPVLSMEDNFDIYSRLDSTLGARFPGNLHVDLHRKRVEDFRRSGILDKATKR